MLRREQHWCSRIEDEMQCQVPHRIALECDSSTASSPLNLEVKELRLAMVHCDVCGRFLIPCRVVTQLHYLWDPNMASQIILNIASFSGTSARICVPFEPNDSGSFLWLAMFLYSSVLLNTHASMRWMQMHSVFHHMAWATGALFRWLVEGWYPIDWLLSLRWVLMLACHDWVNKPHVWRNLSSHGDLSMI